MVTILPKHSGHAVGNLKSVQINLTATYTHTQIQTDIHSDVHTQIPNNTGLSLTHTFSHVHIHRETLTHSHIHLGTSSHTPIHTHIPRRTHPYMYSHSQLSCLCVQYQPHLRYKGCTITE